MTDQEIKDYVDARITEALRSRPSAIPSRGSYPEDALAAVEFQQEAMIELLTELVPGFDRAALLKKRTALESDTQAHANQVADDLTGRMDREWGSLLMCFP